MLSSPSPPRLSILQTFARKEFLPLIPDRVWLLEQGLVRTLTWNSEGRITTFGIWGRGDIVGLPLSRLSPYQVECLTPVVVTEILPGNQSSFLYDALLKHLWYSQELFDIVQKTSVSERLFDLLAWLGKRFGHTLPQGTLLEPILTQQQLAELLGSSRVTVTRTLNRLEKEGRLKRYKKSSDPKEEHPRRPYSSGTILLPGTGFSFGASYPG